MKAEDEVIDILAKLNVERQITSSNYTITDEYMTVTEFISQHNELNKYTTEQVGKVLTKLGYESQRKKTNGRATRMKLLPKKEYNKKF